MNKLMAYRCFECGHYNISQKDGVRCQKCNGALQTMGDATYVDKEKNLKVEVSVKDTKLFQKMLKVFLALIDDPHTPNWIKVKIEELILKEI
ncbi:hypothetical protein [uncultured Clostridium sp.]|jgi:hypothetical protein|uniref:hypothetical protein n=1 Tax=uncultured Clostridium sp. TaxID=59620 RepID=UPI0020707BF7|nr:hypothetical protein [uncultured Clostridium sp.]DAK99866.1 MAG TPA: DNA-directed RNA polymerase II subunit [Caudoviricetes sp.]